MRRPLSLVCLLFVIAVFAYVHLAPPDKAEFGQAEGKTVCLAGKVYHKEVRPSTFGGDNTIIYLNHIAVSSESKSLFENEEKLQGVMCYMKEAQEVPLGSLVVVRGKLQSFMEATNPGEFDSRQYYQILKLDFRLKNVEIERISENYNKLQELLYRVKEKCGVLLEEYYDSIDAGIMKTILLGDKNSLAEEVEEQYKRNGIIHIMAISGLHISMLGVGLYRMLRKGKVSVWTAGITCVMFIWCYGIMTGMSASATRAIIMFGMRIIADVIGRTYDMLTALAVAAVLILLEQPLYVKHCGFLLSFCAVIGISLVLPQLEEGMKVLTGVRRRKAVRVKAGAVVGRGVGGTAGKGVRKVVDRVVSGLDAGGVVGRICSGLLSGVAIFLPSFPIQIYFYYQYPIYSILLNLLIVPLMTVVMVTGLAALFLGVVAEGIRDMVAMGTIGMLAEEATGLMEGKTTGMVAVIETVGSVLSGGSAFIGHMILQVYSFACEAVEQLPGAVLVTGQPKAWQMALYYLFLLLFLSYPAWKRLGEKWRPNRGKGQKKARDRKKNRRKNEEKVWKGKKNLK